MSSTVAVGGFELISSSESAEDMAAALTPKAEDEKLKPRIVQREGKPVEPQDEQAEVVSKAASELGKRGGEAAAKAREERKAAEAKPEPKEAAEAKPEAKPDDKPAEPEEKPHRGDPRRDPEARVRAATSQLAEANRRNQQLEERLARLEQAVQPPKPAAEEQRQAEAPVKPTVDQFSTYEEYVEALADYKADQRIRETLSRIEAQQQQSAAKQEVMRNLGTLDAQFQEAQKADPSVVERLDPRLLSTMSGALANPGDWSEHPGRLLTHLLMNSEQGFAMMLHLSENEDAAIGLIKQPNPLAMSRAFGLLEAKLAAQQSQPDRRPSQAPPPLKPLTPTAQPSDDIYGDMPFDQFMARSRGKR